MELKIFVATSGTEIGARKDGKNDFGTVVPNYWGDTMTLITGAYSDGTDFIITASGKVDGKDTLKLTAASGATISPAWDAGSSSYKVAVGPFKAILASHYDGTLDLLLEETQAPVVVAPGKPGTPTFASITATGAKVNWTAPTTGDAVVNYEVKVTKAGADITGSPFTMAGGTLTKTLSGLDASTAYEVTIKAINSGGAGTSTAATLTTTA